MPGFYNVPSTVLIVTGFWLTMDLDLGKKKTKKDSIYFSWHVLPFVGPVRENVPYSLPKLIQQSLGGLHLHFIHNVSNADWIKKMWLNYIDPFNTLYISTQTHGPFVRFIFKLCKTYELHHVSNTTKTNHTFCFYKGRILKYWFIYIFQNTV